MFDSKPSHANFPIASISRNINSHELAVKLLKGSSAAATHKSKVLLQIQAVESMTLIEGIKKELLEDLYAEFYFEKLKEEFRLSNEPREVTHATDGGKTLALLKAVHEDVNKVLGLTGDEVDTGALKNFLASTKKEYQQPMYFIEDYARDLVKNEATVAQGKALRRWAESKAR